MTESKRPAGAAMVPRTYRVLEMAVTDGVALGWSHAHKHVDDPTPEAIRSAIVRDVLLQMDEWFRFEDEAQQ